MFILWGSLLLASVAGGRTGSGGAGKPRSYMEQARATASFLLGANAAAPTTHGDISNEVGLVNLFIRGF
jgi:hypothetical protein